jgi:DNA invertase Pin-like site-specific DNA recombinase
MSRAILIMALAQTIGRPPTDEERAEYLAALAGLAGGEYLYIPVLQQAVAVDAARIYEMHSAGQSIRKIARVVGCSKSNVHRVLSQFSPYVLDTEAA